MKNVTGTILRACSHQPMRSQSNAFLLTTLHTHALLSEVTISNSLILLVLEQGLIITTGEKGIVKGWHPNNLKSVFQFTASKFFDTSHVL